MNWKIVVGALLIIGSVREMFSIIGDYNSGKLKSWPFGADIAFVLLFALGIYLIYSGRKNKKLS
ncbi:MAG: hypothetical protein J0I32_19055 [Sphingobacteriales bacterium]|nr:hypothetical protein [Sphingobacteriales bacterium]OJV97958.1 MAG: hypothetical protein BGO52_10945 [Sphingobacteriales bacterium 44-61]